MSFGDFSIFIGLLFAWVPKLWVPPDRLADGVSSSLDIDSSDRFFSLFSNSVRWAPQDKSPSHGSSTTWSTVSSRELQEGLWGFDLHLPPTQAGLFSGAQPEPKPCELPPPPDGSSGNWVSGRLQVGLGSLSGMWRWKETSGVPPTPLPLPPAGAGIPSIHFYGCCFYKIWIQGGGSDGEPSIHDGGAWRLSIDTFA